MHLCKYIFFIFRFLTPRKLFPNDYYNNIISPYKEFNIKSILDTPLHPNNYIISSPANNFRFNSPNSKITNIFIYLYNFLQDLFLPKGKHLMIKILFLIFKEKEQILMKIMKKWIMKMKIKIIKI